MLSGAALLYDQSLLPLPRRDRSESTQSRGSNPSRELWMSHSRLGVQGGRQLAVRLSRGSNDTRRGIRETLPGTRLRMLPRPTPAIPLAPGGEGAGSWEGCLPGERAGITHMQTFLCCLPETPGLLARPAPQKASKRPSSEWVILKDHGSCSMHFSTRDSSEHHVSLVSLHNTPNTFQMKADKLSCGRAQIQTQVHACELDLVWGETTTSGTFLPCFLLVVLENRHNCWVGQGAEGILRTRKAKGKQ